MILSKIFSLNTEYIQNFSSSKSGKSATSFLIRWPIFGGTLFTHDLLDFEKILVLFCGKFLFLSGGSCF